VEDKIKVLLHSIEQDKAGGPLRVIVSRADRLFVQRLFEKEVPEIFEKIVTIKSIGRIPGERSKVVVASERSNVDPVGACVGVRGVRIQAIVRELGNERVDIIEWSSDPREFITNALTPATPSLVKADPNAREALAVVPDKDLAIAIGREGSNVKLASYVTGYKIDVKSESQFSAEMASPEARRRLDEIFDVTPVEKAPAEEEGTPLSALPGLAPRIIRILNENNVKYIEDLVSMGEEDLIHIEGIGRATAKRIMEIIAENVEFETAEEEAEGQELDADAKA
jgi:N utilization substance protein A